MFAENGYGCEAYEFDTILHFNIHECCIWLWAVLAVTPMSFIMDLNRTVIQS